MVNRDSMVNRDKSQPFLPWCFVFLPELGLLWTTACLNKHKLAIDGTFFICILCVYGHINVLFQCFGMWSDTVPSQVGSGMQRKILIQLYT